MGDGAASSTRGFGGCEGCQARCLTQRGAWKTRCGFPPYIRCPVPGARCPVPGRSGGACWVFGRRVDDGAASSTRGFGGCEGPPGSVPYATGRVENALRFSTYIRRPPPGRSGAPVGYLAVEWMTAQPHPRVGSAAARVRQARCLTQRGAWKRFAVFHPTSGACRPGDRAALVGGRRVDDGAASSTRGVAGCEGPPGSMPYATGRVENALRFSTLRSRRWPRAGLLTSPAPPSCPAGGGRSLCGSRCRSLPRWPGRWSGTWLHADSGE